MGRPRVLNQVEIKAMVEGFFIFVFLSPPLIYRLPFFVLVKLILKSHCLTDGSHTVPLIGFPLSTLAAFFWRLFLPVFFTFSRSNYRSQISIMTLFTVLVFINFYMKQF